MNEVLFWTWAPGLLTLLVIFGLVMGWLDRRDRDRAKHRHDPAE